MTKRMGEVEIIIAHSQAMTFCLSPDALVSIATVVAVRRQTSLRKSRELKSSPSLLIWSLLVWDGCPPFIPSAWRRSPGGRHDRRRRASQAMPVTLPKLRSVPALQLPSLSRSGLTRLEVTSHGVELHGGPREVALSRLRARASDLEGSALPLTTSELESKLWD